MCKLSGQQVSSQDFYGVIMKTGAIVVNALRGSPPPPPRNPKRIQCHYGKRFTRFPPAGSSPPSIPQKCNTYIIPLILECCGPGSETFELVGSGSRNRLPECGQFGMMFVMSIFLYFKKAKFVADYIQTVNAQAKDERSKILPIGVVELYLKLNI